MHAARFPNKQMKTKLLLTLTALLALANVARAQNTTFTYQGQLGVGGAPATGSYDIRAQVYNRAVAGEAGDALVSPTVNVAAVPVSNGLFTVTLDFGVGVFTGADRWLLLSVTTNGGGVYTALTPRQKLTASPYAVFAGSAQSAVTMAAGGVDSTAIADGSIFSSDLSPALLSNTFWRLGGNTGAGSFLGSTDNQPLELRVNNVAGLRLQPNGVEAPAVIGGSSANAINPGTIGSVIAGGGNTGGFDNTITVNYGSIGGGADNHVEGQEGTVAGGNQNLVSGAGGFVGGGRANWAGGSRSAVAGGYFNEAQSPHSFVGGGRSNLAIGDFAVVAGGSTNRALNFNATVGGGSRNIARNTHDTVGGGGGNEAAGGASTIAGGWFNRVDGYIATVGGGQFNVAEGQSSVIGGGAGNRTADYATVGGGRFNFALGTNATIAGGTFNQALGSSSFVGGGTNNVAGGLGSVVGGGYGNYISNRFAISTTIAGGGGNFIGADSIGSTIGGGQANSTEAYSQWSVIAGGSRNTNAPFMTRAVISGGQENHVTGSYGTIPGGFWNEAGDSALAAGSAAKARHRGSWVWADNAAGFDLSGNHSGADFASTGTNQFLVRASGGVGINTNNPQATLHVRGNIAADALRAPGAGINTGTFAFVHRAANTNTAGHITTLDHPLCNGDSGAILIVTHNWTADNSANRYHPQVVGVYYTGGRWNLFHEDNTTAMEVGDAFNVMVIKP
jgi:hypothetical protein